MPFIKSKEQTKLYTNNFLFKSTTDLRESDMDMLNVYTSKPSFIQTISSLNLQQTQGNHIETKLKYTCHDIKPK